MRKTTPSEALTRIVNFNSRVDRLTLDNYSDKKFRTADLNKLKSEIRHMHLLSSLGIFNKNKERAEKIIKELKIKFKSAAEIIHY